MQIDDLLQKVETLVEPILTSMDYELVEREYVTEMGRNILRLYVDRKEGQITIADCQKISRSVEATLDVEDLISGRYCLEVSSPGIERPLRKLKDFQRFAGKIIDLKLKNPIEGRHHFKGLLKGIQENQILIEDEKKEWLIPLDLLKKAKLLESKP